MYNFMGDLHTIGELASSTQRDPGRRVLNPNLVIGADFRLGPEDSIGTFGRGLPV